MPRMTGGQALVQQLKREGLDTIFGLPGVQLDWAFDAIYEERDHFRVIQTRHEQGAAYMADGFARSTGKVGAFIVVPGPGVFNAMGALCTAYACNSQVLCITSSIDAPLIGLNRGILHEVPNQMGALASVTKWQGRAMSPADVPGIVHEAFRQLHTGRPRPVEIEVPPDILRAEADAQLIDAVRFDPPAGDADLIDQAARLLGEAKAPLIFAGGGVIRGGAWAELQEVAEMLEAPVIATENARGAISDRIHLAHGYRVTPVLAADADVILAVGTRFLTAIDPAWQREGTKVIQIDIDDEELGRNYKPDVGIIADAKKGLAGLAERIGRYNHRRDSRREELMALKHRVAADGDGIQPQAALGHALRAEMPDDAILVGEMTQVGYWARTYMPMLGPRTYFTPGYQGTLGFGFATAIGVQVGNPDRRVVSINGDGGFFFNVQELSTMKQQKLPLIAIVFNDGLYGNVRRIQEARFGNRTIASDVFNPDVLKLAEAYGIAGRRATDANSLRTELRAALDSGDACVIEVPVPSMEIFAGLPPYLPLQRN